MSSSTPQGGGPPGARRTEKSTIHPDAALWLKVACPGFQSCEGETSKPRASAAQAWEFRPNDTGPCRGGTGNGWERRGLSRPYRASFYCLCLPRVSLRCTLGFGVPSFQDYGPLDLVDLAQKTTPLPDTHAFPASPATRLRKHGHTSQFDQRGFRLLSFFWLKKSAATRAFPGGGHWPDRPRLPTPGSSLALRLQSLPAGWLSLRSLVPAGHHHRDRGPKQGGSPDSSRGSRASTRCGTRSGNTTPC